MAKKKAAAPKPPESRWVMSDGVGFNGERTQHGNYKSHYVVLRVGVICGIDAFGPFIDRESAEAWIRKSGESANYERFDTGNPPGVHWHVEWMEVPTHHQFV